MILNLIFKTPKKATDDMLLVFPTITFIPPSFLRPPILLGVPPRGVPDPLSKFGLRPPELGLINPPVGLFLAEKPFNGATIVIYKSYLKIP